MCRLPNSKGNLKLAGIYDKMFICRHIGAFKRIMVIRKINQALEI